MLMPATAAMSVPYEALGAWMVEEKFRQTKPDAGLMAREDRRTRPVRERLHCAEIVFGQYMAGTCGTRAFSALGCSGERNFLTLLHSYAHRF